MIAPDLRSIADVIAATFERQAQRLGDAGEDARASINPLPSSQMVVALEVRRQGGDWQRNLVVTLNPSSSPQIDVRVLDDDQSTVAEVGEASVPPEFIPDLALTLSRAGLVLLLGELGHTPIAA